MTASKSRPESKASSRERPARKNPEEYEMPPLPSLLTRPLGLEGWTACEPVLLAALTSAEPLLLIGPHGSAKSFLLERLALALDLEFRFYNASLINYDDLVGIPMPAEDRKSLHYISTPSAIWDAEVVFFDEINRTRPELQNKLFPIIHERRVQGIALERLRYRWSAMNPPPSPDGAEEDADVYLGAEPLDPALADRFSFLIEVPGWQQLADEEKRRIFRDQFTGPHSFPVPLRELIAMADRHLKALQADPPRNLEDYLLSMLAHLESGKLLLSARRATMLHRNILAVHAARMALYGAAFPETPPGLADWNTSALLALQNSIPQVAQGRKPEAALLLAAHRHAWEVSKLDADNPWRELLHITDPLDRCIAGVCMGERIDDDYLSKLVLDAVASQQEPAFRKAVGLALYAALHSSRNLHATVFETLAQDLRPILKPDTVKHDPDDFPRQSHREVQRICSELSKEAKNKSTQRNRYARNLLQGLLPDGFDAVTPAQVRNRFFKLWDEMVPEQEQNKKEA